MTRPPGYLLQVEAERLDVARFERFLGQARDAEPRERAALLREGLALWRGPPLADLAYERFAESEIRRLEEMRLEALEQRVDADLALGRGGELVPELETLIAEQPLRERLRGQHMLALYRAGRQADALEAYQAARRTLVEELGVEPSPALQELQGAILRQDPALAPAPRPTPTPKLPAQPTPFLGRERELAEVVALLQRADLRLFTLTGAGGSGKTRLALRAAAEVAPDYRDGVWWVPLASVRDPELVPASIAQALRISDAQELAKHIGERRLLLLLDNCEHLLAAAPALGALLSACPNLKLLAASREPLHLAGEREYLVPSLAENEAVELFRQRADAAEPERAVLAICRRLDCLPLAIELAAARTKVLPPEVLLQRLEKRLPLLTGGPRDAPERQRTLEATITWSYDLLAEGERRLFGRLSVFTGGCTLEAAEWVCEADLDTLQLLLEKNLLRREGERFTMLETIREYAAAALAQSDDIEDVRRRHAVFFVELAEDAGAAFDRRDEASWYRSIEREYANMDSVLAHSYERSDSTTVLRIVCGTWRYWLARRPEEGRQWIERAMSEHVEPTLGERATASLAWFMLIRGEFVGAKSLGEELRRRHEAAGDRVGVGRALNLLAFTAREEGDLDRARVLASESLSIARLYDPDETVAVRLANLGTFERTLTLYEDATEHLDESIAIARRCGIDPYYALSQLALVEIGQGNAARALPLLIGALRRLSGSLDTRNTVQVLEAMAAAFATRGDVERATRLCGAADAARESMGMPLDSDDQALRAVTQNAIKTMDSAPSQEPPTQPMTLDEAVSYALEAVE
jgi:predicted ATPase